MALLFVNILTSCLLIGGVQVPVMQSACATEGSDPDNELGGGKLAQMATHLPCDNSK